VTFRAAGRTAVVGGFCALLLMNDQETPLASLPFRLATT